MYSRNFENLPTIVARHNNRYPQDSYHTDSKCHLSECIEHPEDSYCKAIFLKDKFG